MITLAMPFFFHKEKRVLKIIACFAIALLVISSSCFAQANQRLPDSVNVDDTVSFDQKPIEETVITDTASRYEEKADEDSILWRAVPDSVIEANKKEKDFQYANDPAYWVVRPVKPNNFGNYFGWIGSRWFRILALVLVVGVLLFALYKIVAENKLYMFYSSPKKINSEKTGETDISYANLDEKIKEAINSGDFRMALRYMYLKGLKKAGDREIIHFHANGTNQDYIRQMNNHPAEKDFRFLTNVYEYVWYGGFPLSAGQFGSLQTQFANLYNTIDR